MYILVFLYAHCQINSETSCSYRWGGGRSKSKEQRERHACQLQERRKLPAVAYLLLSFSEVSVHHVRGSRASQIAQHEGHAPPWAPCLADTWQPCHVESAEPYRHCARLARICSRVRTSPRRPVEVGHPHVSRSLGVCATMGAMPCDCSRAFRVESHTIGKQR